MSHVDPVIVSDSHTQGEGGQSEGDFTGGVIRVTHTQKEGGQKGQ